MTVQEQIDFVIGPQIVTGDYFDQTLLAQARKYGELFPATPPAPDQMDTYVLMNYYDLARSEYVAHARTGDPTFLTLARKVADSWYQCPYFKNGSERNPDNNTSPKFAGLVGLMLRAIDDRQEMWDSLNYWTRYYFDLWIKRRAAEVNSDFQLREAAFSLQFAALLAHLLPDSFPLTAGGTETNGAQLRAQYLAEIENIAIPYFKRLQFPDGSWRWDDWYYTDADGGQLRGIMQPFMVGMLTRALCDAIKLPLKATTIADIKTMICNACRHLYSDGPFSRGIVTAFNVELGGFHYFYHGGTTVNPTKYEKGDFPFDTTVDWHVSSAKQLMATCLGSYAKAFELSGDAFFKNAGEEMYRYAYSGADGFRGMMNDTAKNFNQHVFGTSNYKAWMSGTSQPQPEPIPSNPSPQPIPASESGNNTRVPPTLQIVDAAGAIWTRATNGAILRNGVSAAGGAGPEILYCNHVVYAFGTDSQWWKWNNGWTPVGSVDPCAVTPTPVPPDPQPEPAPAPTPVPCSMTVSVPTLSQWGSGKLVVNLTGLTNEPHTVTLTVDSGQITASPRSQSFTGTSGSLEFRLDAKKKSSKITVSGPCGSQTVTVNVK